jgi:hypothetical protein
LGKAWLEKNWKKEWMENAVNSFDTYFESYQRPDDTQQRREVCQLVTSAARGLDPDAGYDGLPIGTGTSDSQDYEDELQRFKKAVWTQVLPDVDVLQWYKERTSTFPTISRMMKVNFALFKLLIFVL